MPFQICNNLAKFKNIKTKNVQISFDRLYAKKTKNSLQNLCNPFPYVIGFSKS